MSRIFYSKPSYSPVSPQPHSRHHLIIADASGAARAAKLQAACAGPNTVLLIAPADARLPEAELREPRELADRLSALIAQLPAGTSCYLFGRESFIWPAAIRLQDLGTARSQIHVERCGPMVRDVLCIHCKTRMHDVTDTLVCCDGCDLLLWNYDHFSRRHGAYMGFQVNAEQADDTPVAEALSS